MYYMVEHTKVENQMSKIVSLLVMEFNSGHILNLCICVTTLSMFYSSITTQEQIFMREISEECGAVIQWQYLKMCLKLRREERKKSPHNKVFFRSDLALACLPLGFNITYQAQALMLTQTISN